MTETLKGIAKRIDAHLKRFEADPALNPDISENGTGRHPFYKAGAWSTGARVQVRYVLYQGAAKLKKTDALDYLNWLDGGGVGKHYEFLRYRDKATSGGN